MQFNYSTSEKEYQIIKKVIEDVLSLYQYDYMSAEDDNGGCISMSKKTFFEQLKMDLNVYKDE